MMRFTQPRQRRPFHQPPGRENAHQHKEYAAVTAILANRTDSAILISNEQATPAIWLPKTALDAAGRITAEHAVLKSEIKIGVELNMAMQKKLV